MRDDNSLAPQVRESSGAVTVEAGELAELEASLTWARPTGYAPPMSWHRVATIGPDSIVTACDGRWSLLDPYETSAEPPEPERCGGCAPVLAPCPVSFGPTVRIAMSPVTAGLAELKHAPMVRTLRASDEFEMFDISDEDGGEG